MTLKQVSQLRWHFPNSGHQPATQKHWHFVCSRGRLVNWRSWTISRLKGFWNKSTVWQRCRLSPLALRVQRKLQLFRLHSVATKWHSSSYMTLVSSLHCPTPNKWDLMDVRRTFSMLFQNSDTVCHMGCGYAQTNHTKQVWKTENYLYIIVLLVSRCQQKQKQKRKNEERPVSKRIGRKERPLDGDRLYPCTSGAPPRCKCNLVALLTV